MNSHQSEWFVVRTKPRKEELAVQSLERRGVAAFCPWIQEPVGMTNDWATVPLFPSYVFVHINLLNEYYSVIWTPGVKGFVSFGTLPTALKPEVVNFLQQEADEDGVIRPASRFRSGERVQIKRGPFAGLIGIIEMPCPERGRIRVLMDFLRDGAAVELPLAAVGRL
jgi:transcriptional antiterminator RfaH